jgi:hypothetical protein
LVKPSQNEEVLGYDKAKLILHNTRPKPEIGDKVDLIIPEGIIKEEKPVEDYQKPLNNKYGKNLIRQARMTKLTATQAIRAIKDFDEYTTKIIATKTACRENRYYKLLYAARNLHIKMLRDYPRLCILKEVYLELVQKNPDLFNTCLYLIREENDLSYEVGRKFGLDGNPVRICEIIPGIHIV